MCGIFGAALGPGSAFLRDGGGRERLDLLFRLSASRGKEAAGLTIATGDALVIYKQPMPAPEMIRMAEFGAMVRAELPDAAAPRAFIGHSRLVTDGAREINVNNQPVATSGIVGIHNGIVVNHDALWAAHPELQRRLDVDSEVIFALIRWYLDRGEALEQATASTFARLEGAASIAALFADRDQLLLATNNGSLYYRADRSTNTFVFASERYILATFLQRSGLDAELASGEIVAVRPGEGLRVDLSSIVATRFGFDAPSPATAPLRPSPRRLDDRSPAVAAPRRPRAPAPDFAAVARRFPHVSTTRSLRRCTRCVLPETMPFLVFDRDGVCNYCRNYQPIKVRGVDALEQVVAPFRRTDGRPDCVVGISGGRDSMYGLHYVKTVLGMNPVAFTYDWGMVTDLARRNISRICGKLGIEHILVSADIDQKRSYIRQNVEAWLKKPSLGTVPLFMAGDKAYFHHLNKVRDQVGAPLGILCENMLERTDFKTGYAGVRPHVADDVRAYTIHPGSKVKLASFYLSQFLRNPAYLNSSLLDTALAFAYFYVIKRDYTNLFGYVPWEEETVVRTLTDLYDFERAPDTESTWRIGDGTAAFYNYIYYAVSGFTEHDTLRSNQIREGVLARDEALRLIERDNQPRFPSIQWYLDVLGIERSLDDVLATINRIPKRYAAA